jgi:protocatechuate 3,4-dioxygenase beta subunit
MINGIESQGAFDRQARAALRRQLPRAGGARERRDERTGTLGGASRPAVAAALRAPLFRYSCQLTPDNIQGPFYLDLDLLRKNITEGKPGLPLWLFFKVIRGSDCSPMPGVVIDIWHNDALGKYSGFASEGTAGETFLRGVQFTDINGFAYFESIYPGWYHGRTTHVHLKVYPTLDGTAANLTTQLFFLDPLTNLIYQLIDPYTQRGPKDTTNAQDAFYTPETQLPWIIAPGGAGIWAGMVLVVP